MRCAAISRAAPRDAPPYKRFAGAGHVKEAQALRNLQLPAALKRGTALRPQVEATGYGPLRAELLELIGSTGAQILDVATTEAMLHEALFAAEATRDDATAGHGHYLISSSLSASSAERTFARRQFDFHLSESILDRAGPGRDRIRGWALNNFAVAVARNGDFRGSCRAQRAVEFKQPRSG